jgi:outer membrane protein
MKEILKDKKTIDRLLVILLIAVIVVFLIIITGKSFSGRSPGIFIVDTDRIIRNHPVLQEARNNFQEQLMEMQRKLEEMEEGEEKTKEQQNMQQQIQQSAMNMQNEAIEKAMADIRSIAEEKGYALVLDKNSIIVGGKDVTEEILSAVENEETPVKREIDSPVMPMTPVEPVK